MEVALALMCHGEGMGAQRPTQNVWEKQFFGDDRIRRFERMIVWARDVLLPHKCECVVVVDAGLTWMPHHFAMLVGAFDACRISLAAPIPNADGTANMVAVPSRSKRKQPNPLQLMELGFAAFDPAVFRAFELPLRRATTADRCAADWQICEALGGVAPLRLDIGRPNQTPHSRCKPEVLARVPSLIGLAAPTLLGPVPSSEPEPETMPLP